MIFWGLFNFQLDKVFETSKRTLVAKTLDQYNVGVACSLSSFV